MDGRRLSDSVYWYVSGCTTIVYVCYNIPQPKKQWKTIENEKMMTKTKIIWSLKQQKPFYRNYSTMLIV